MFDQHETKQFAGPLAQGVLDLVFAFLGRYSIPPRAKRRRPGGDPPRKYSRRSPAEVAPLWARALKNRPKNGIEFRTAFGPQSVAKSTPKTLAKLTKICNFSVFVSVTCSSLFLDELLRTFKLPNSHFNCYLECFREVQHFSRSLDN